jgi:hypothetical protein
MTHQHSTDAVSRRSALAGLGAGGLGLALGAARPAAAQEAATDMAKHPVVGFWQNRVTGPDAATMPWTFSLYHADGTYHEWNGLDAGAALGIWRPAGERTAELLFIYQDTDPTTATETPGTATFRMTIDADDTGDALSAKGNLDVRDPAGTLLLTIPDAKWTSTRVTFDHNPATGSTAVTPTDATPTP